MKNQTFLIREKSNALFSISLFLFGKHKDTIDQIIPGDSTGPPFIYAKYNYTWHFVCYD